MSSIVRSTSKPSFHDLLREAYPFFVHIYQREYSWEDEEIDDFIKDVTNLIDQRNTEEEEGIEPHFYGGIVSVHHSADNVANRKHEIVDGQQRIATITMALSTVVEALEELETMGVDGAGAHKEQMKEDYIYYKSIVGNTRTSKPKITLSRIDNNFFQRVTSGEEPDPQRESHKRILSAKNKIKERLLSPILNNTDINNQEKFDEILTISKSIAHDSQVIHIVTRSRENAYRLFSVLNDRGRTLSDADLLRSKTLELLQEHPTKQDTVVDLWNDIFSVGQSDIDSFLRSYYPSHVGERTPRHDLFDKYCEHFFDYEPIDEGDNDTASEIVSRVRDLRNEQRLYQKITDGEWPYDDPTVSAWEKDRLDRLVNVLRHSLCHPLLLSACHLDEDKFVEIASLLERFVYRYIVVVSAHANTLYSPYYEHAVKVRNEDNYDIEELREDLYELVQERAGDNAFESGLREKLLYSKSSKDKRAIKHLLTNIEDYRRWYNNGAPRRPQTDKLSSYDINQITLEHIYPRNAREGDVDEDLEPRKNRIGNLTFWGENDNRNAGNDPFEDKVDRYEESNIPMTNQLSDLDRWTLEEYENREQNLIERAVEIFDLHLQQQ
ncbi:MAG: DUF262 domain-containing protein [Salinibacter sp.]